MCLITLDCGMSEGMAEGGCGARGCTWCACGTKACIKMITPSIHRCELRSNLSVAVFRFSTHVAP